MDPISILITLVIIGFILWLVQKLPINDTIKQIIIGVVILFIIVELIRILAPMAHGFHL
jgi:ABC-type siderophore export system fused ATPase/permease subunit